MAAAVKFTLIVLLMVAIFCPPDGVDASGQCYTCGESMKGKEKIFGIGEDCQNPSEKTPILDCPWGSSCFKFVYKSSDVSAYGRGCIRDGSEFSTTQLPFKLPSKSKALALTASSSGKVGSCMKMTVDEGEVTCCFCGGDVCNSARGLHDWPLPLPTLFILAIGVVSSYNIMI